MARPSRPWFRLGRGWYVQIEGKQVFLGVTDPNARKAALEAFQKLLDGGGPAAPVVTVADAVPAYLAAVRHRISARTMVGYTRSLNWFVRRFGDQDVTRLDPLKVEAAAADEGHFSDSHRCNLLWLCQAVVRHAGRKDFALRRPGKESRGSSAVISLDTQKRILHATAGDFRQLCRLLWATGARPAEAAGLTVEMVNWEAGTASLRYHKTKHKGKTRVLYFSPEAMEILREQRAIYPTGLLFRGDGGRMMGTQSLTKRFRVLRQRLGVRVSAVCYRHTYATRALAAGVPAAQVAALLGHSSIRMIEAFYGHVGAEAELLKGTAARLDGAA